jgi:uncharacterized coiled-coil DUF342 family protein
MDRFEEQSEQITELQTQIGSMEEEREDQLDEVRKLKTQVQSLSTQILST